MGALPASIAVAIGTYYGASLVQFGFHRAFGHRRRIRALFRAHISGHHAQYDRIGLLSKGWISPPHHVTWWFAFPLGLLAIGAFSLLSPQLFCVHLGALGFAIWWHVYLHRQYHLEDSWLCGMQWFERKRQLHFLHHRRPHGNYAIVEYGWDKLFGTFADPVRYTHAPPRRQPHVHS